jgi:hypothetical protein
MNVRIVPLTVLALCLCSTAQPQRKPPTAPASKPAESAEPLYRNPTFGFRYRIPYGWVERTKEMQEGNDAAKGEVLFAIFERPPQAAGETINSAVVIAAESAATYPGLKKAEDYLGPLTELTTSKGFKADGDPSEAEIDTQRLVRADFSKPLNEKLTMHQTTLALLAKGQIVSFTFLADNDDAVNGLIDRLSFSALKSKAK